MLLVTSTGKHFHAHDIARDDFGIQKIVNSLADGRTGIVQKFYPGRGVDKNQSCLLLRISSRSPIHPVPRRFRASSSPSGSAANVRNAKFIASRFVVSRYRRITVAHALSSISIFVRDIHKTYTISPQSIKPCGATCGHEISL